MDVTNRIFSELELEIDRIGEEIKDKSAAFQAGAAFALSRVARALLRGSLEALDVSDPDTYLDDN